MCRLLFLTILCAFLCVLFCHMYYSFVAVRQSYGASKEGRERGNNATNSSRITHSNNKTHSRQQYTNPNPNANPNPIPIFLLSTSSYASSAALALIAVMCTIITTRVHSFVLVSSLTFFHPHIHTHIS